MSLAVALLRPLAMVCSVLVLDRRRDQREERLPRARNEADSPETSRAGRSTNKAKYYHVARATPGMNRSFSLVPFSPANIF